MIAVVEARINRVNREQQNTVHSSYDGELKERRIGVRIAGHLGVPTPADFAVTLNYRDTWIDFQPAR